MYDASCDGTWLLMQDIYTKRVFDSTDHDYENSDIHNYLQNTFINLFDSNIKDVIKQVKIPYRKGVGVSETVMTGANGLSAKAFLLSVTEVYSLAVKKPVEGVTLDYFDGKYDSVREASSSWHLRTPALSGNKATYLVYGSGMVSTGGCTASQGIRPAIVFPPEYGVSSDGMITLSSKAITGSVNINGVQRELTGAGYINIGGVLRDLSDSQSNIGGTLRSTKG
jgi:hypothetical protein